MLQPISTIWKEVYIQLQNERKHQYQMIMAQYNELNKESQI